MRKEEKRKKKLINDKTKDVNGKKEHKQRAWERERKNGDEKKEEHEKRN